METKLNQLKEIMKHIKEPKSDLDIYDTDWKFAFAVIMSSQTKDSKVNEIAPNLFRKYLTLEDFKKASPDEVAELINSIPFYKNKAANLVKTAGKLLDDHDGKIPSDMDSLTKLNGVGRKVANVLRNNIHKLSGVVVDVHVARVSKRLGWTTEKTPEKIEADLATWIPEADQATASNSIVLFGRYTCKAKKPLCGECPLATTCPSKS